MVSAAKSIIFRHLCEHHGGLEFGRLEQLMARGDTIEPSLLRAVLFDEELIAIKEQKGKRSGSLQISQKSLVVAKTTLRLCKKNAGECEGCEGLHLCRYHVCGECRFGQKCKKPHSLSTPYNARLLKEHDLSVLSEKQLFYLLIQNDSFLLPEICPHYNKGNGVHGSCKYATTCNKLHVCRHHFQGSCSFGSSCKRTHKLNDQMMKSFQGVSGEIMNNLFKIYRNKFIILEQPKKPDVLLSDEDSSPSPPPSRKKPELVCAKPVNAKSHPEIDEICLFFLRHSCTFKEKCVRVHWPLPYKWEVLNSDGVSWDALDNNEMIEEAYCDPSRDTFSTDTLTAAAQRVSIKEIGRRSESEPLVDFITMTSEGSPVRRLSTASSLSKPTPDHYTTQWLWYWKGDDGKWREFGQSDGDTPAKISTQTIEKVFLADSDAEIAFSVGQQQFIIHFKDAAGTPRMYQQNTASRARREVRRRPRFVSSQDVQSLHSPSSQVSPSNASSPSSSSSAANFPSSWDKTCLPSSGYQMVLLSRSTLEYRMIERLFKLTMPESEITSIQRIQNPYLWKLFQWQKDQMKERNGGKFANELHLFHGTRAELVNSICEKNFDWRTCSGRNTMYGKGTYFAKDASVSNQDSNASDNKMMFSALVLVGDYTAGHHSFEQPPIKGSGGHRYDSCVNSESNPTIFVIFDSLQIYPEYLIQYS